MLARGTVTKSASPACEHGQAGAPFVHTLDQDGLDLGNTGLGTFPHGFGAPVTIESFEGDGLSGIVPGYEFVGTGTIRDLGNGIVLLDQAVVVLPGGAIAIPHTICNRPFLVDDGPNGVGKGYQ